MVSMKVRNLCLGSVNSLSFEEEEKKEHVNHRNMQLHEMLTDCLQEQVEYLLSFNYSDVNRNPINNLTFLGLRSVLDEVVHDILRLAEPEPYGVRGATIVLNLLEGKKSAKERPIGAVAVDTSTVSTFRLHLTLREESSLAVTFKNWLGQLTGGSQAKVMGPKFTLRKEQLYRTESTILEYY